MSTPLFRITSPLATLDDGSRRALNDWRSTTGSDVAARVRTIVDDVRRRGDVALRQLARELDGVELDALEIPRGELSRAVNSLDPPLRAALERARDNIAAVHRAMRPRRVRVEPECGVTIVRRPDPLDRVGVYAPGGTALYPSSVLMGVVPAKVAGVPEVILATPPTSSGRPAPVLLAAAGLAGVDRVFAIGGAGAVAALAYGTESVPRVQRIVGPGNAYVAEAKLIVSRDVGIDSPAGPSELLIIVDDSVDVAGVAFEIMAQAEHDERACVIVIALSEPVALAIDEALRRGLSGQPRASIITSALAARGALLWASRDHIDDVIALANEIAAEHVLVATGDAERLEPRLRNAGALFIGEYSSVTFGDYLTGANHVLPTGGRAGGYSGLSTDHFVRWTTVQHVDRDAAAHLAGDVALLATHEQLFAHAAAASRWAAA